MSIGSEGVKGQEKHEMLLFQVMVLLKNGQFKEAYEHLTKNQKSFIDTPTYLEFAIILCSKLGNNEVAHDYIMKALTNNSENLNYFINYFNLKENLNLKSFQD